MAYNEPNSEPACGDFGTSRLCCVLQNSGAFMTVYAEHLIAQHELNFGKVFSQQYVLSKEASFAVTSFAPHTHTK